MWPVGVVALDVVGDEALELAAVPDDGSVEELSSDGSDPSLGEGVRDRGADRGLEDLEALRSEYLVERVDELAASVADQGPSRVEAVGVGEEQVAGCLGCPRTGRVGRGPGVEDLAAGTGVGRLRVRRPVVVRVDYSVPMGTLWQHLHHEQT